MNNISVKSFPNSSNFNSIIFLKPFVKWAGGKTQILPEIRKIYPEELGTKITKYCEPFVGGGAVLFDVLSKYHFEEVYISDINSELIETYKSIRDNVEVVIGYLKEWQDEYRSLDEVGRKDLFTQRRSRFNEIKSGAKGNIGEVGALFIFLNRTCFNGLYRVNTKNLFNVPMGKYANPLICDEENLKNISKALQNVQIVCGNFKESESFVDSNTFVYFDPPYRPLSVTASFTSYTKDEFNDDNQRELAAYVHALCKKGALVAVSNSDPKNTNENDNFFDDLYSGLNIKRIEATRMINSNAKLRGKIKELLICNY